MLHDTYIFSHVSDNLIKQIFKAEFNYKKYIKMECF